MYGIGIGALRNSGTSIDFPLRIQILITIETHPWWPTQVLATRAYDCISTFAIIMKAFKLFVHLSLSLEPLVATFPQLR